MTATTLAAGHSLNRRTYRLGLLAYVVFVWYGSLVPLNFTAIPIDEALRLFADARYHTMGMDGRTDFVVNVLLFMPIGFLSVGALRVDRRGVLADFLTALAVIPSCALLSMSIEFTELFFPGRTLSFNDMIAQTSGGFLGAAFWLVAGRALTDWFREAAVEREPLALVERLLLAYCVGFAVAQLLPLNFITNLEELAAKYRQGRIVLVPFGYAYPSDAAMLWDHLWDVLLNMPLGAGALLLWLPSFTHRSVGRAIVLSTVAVVVIECGQLLVNTRVADVTDVLKGAIGAALGVMAASRLTRAEYAFTRATSDRLVIMARVALAVWVVALAGYHWNPFDFVLSRAELSRGLDQMLRVPLANYYWAQEFQAFTEFLRKTLLALPLGFMFHLSWPDRGRAFVVKLRWVVGLTAGVGLLLIIELGQALVPSRVPDIADVMIGAAGVLMGLWLAGRLQPTIRLREPDSRSVHAC